VQNRCAFRNYSAPESRVGQNHMWIGEKVAALVLTTR
jgi:hypothetical protein